MLGHYSVSFTLDTYAYVLHAHLNQKMGRMEELYKINQTIPQPITVTPANGGYVLQSIDFPESQVMLTAVEEAIAIATNAMCNAILVLQWPPAPSDPASISIISGQFYYNSLYKCAKSTIRAVDF